MNGLTTSSERNKTSWILVCISTMLTASIIFWYFNNPEGFIENGIGFRTDVFSNIFIWIFALFILMGYIAYTCIAIPFVKAHLFTISWLKVIGVWAAIVGGIVEEVIFRHLLMEYLLTIGASDVMQILISGILFGIAHGLWVLLKGDWKFALPAIISTTILGSLLAMLYIMAGRSTFAPILAHILINMFIEPWLMLSAVSGKWASK
ncbi:CPBP family intramembrane glutamic endopeptidase [Lysinibacillus sp. Bpr_S20]|uniref:CPBP family intramembrane glutamic endopeptidase n=1 Tax=Lysinibacillus sp. Bpr_S20 TaxID=2933964 RepID=UPI002011B0FC|nr:CPBP family intramembrane glutamic endopeptidase [Lysinibacillus sp. Bpr_S20]MCL1702755.1 CPBP family intramembrane metalloprotease [Lysinibacillus sp. Bpr_S20]